MNVNLIKPLEQAFLIEAFNRFGGGFVATVENFRFIRPVMVLKLLNWMLRVGAVKPEKTDIVTRLLQNKKWQTTLAHR